MGVPGDGEKYVQWREGGLESRALGLSCCLCFSSRLTRQPLVAKLAFLLTLIWASGQEPPLWDIRQVHVGLWLILTLALCLINPFSLGEKPKPVEMLGLAQRGTLLGSTEARVCLTPASRVLPIPYSPQQHGLNPGKALL